MNNYEFYNSNPKQEFFKNGKPKIYNGADCIVRAINVVSEQFTWEQAYDFACAASKQVYDMPDSKDGLDEIMRQLSFTFIKLGKPKKNEHRPTVSEVALLTKNTNHRIVCNCAGHVVACKNGKYYDTGDSGDMAVYSYYIKK